MIECAQCGTLLPDGQLRCTSCGAPVVRGEAAATADDAQRLLTEASELRVRCQYDEAIGLCARVLRQDPTHGPAHTMLGDLYAAQGNYREALGWYKMAVNLQPENATLRKKLDETIDLVFQTVGRTEATAASMPVLPARQQANLHRMLANIQPTHVVIACTVLFMVLGVAIFLQQSSAPAQPDSRVNRNSARSTHDDPAATTPGVGESNTLSSATNTQSQITAPPADGVENPDPSVMVFTPAPKPQANNSTARPAYPTARPDAGDPSTAEVPPFNPAGANSVLTPEEVEKQAVELKVALEKALRGSKLSSATLQEAIIDPRTRQATFRFTVPPMTGPAETKKGLLYVAFNLAWAAMKQNNSLQSFNLLGYATQQGKSEPALALIGDLTPLQAQQAMSAGDYQAVVSYLNNPWWRADLSTASLQ